MLTFLSLVFIFNPKNLDFLAQYQNSWFYCATEAACPRKRLGQASGINPVIFLRPCTGAMPHLGALLRGILHYSAAEPNGIKER